jgi:hypothetical protein
MKITFEEHNIRSDLQTTKNNIARRPATPFPSPSLEGQCRVQRFLDNQELNPNNQKQDKAESTEHAKLMRSENSDFRKSRTNVESPLQI